MTTKQIVGKQLTFLKHIVFVCNNRHAEELWTVCMYSIPIIITKTTLQAIKKLHIKTLNNLLISTDGLCVFFCF